jgi:hypothetical protein
METQNVQRIEVAPVKRCLLKVKVEGVEGSTYIPHRLNAETVSGFTDREMGASKKKVLRNLGTEYESCFYYTPDNKYGVPAAAFTSAILFAAVACNLPKTQIKRAVRILGDVLPLGYSAVNKRIDTVRRSGMTAAPDIRHRPEFLDWHTTLTIEYDSNQISPDQIINLINQAGFSSGIGDWRPSSPKSSGTHGIFKVVGDSA